MVGWWRWALVSPDGVAPSRMVSVSASVHLPLHHKVQKIFSGTGWSGKKCRKTVVDVEEILLFSKFFSQLSIHALAVKIQPNKAVRWCADGEFLAMILGPAFSASRVQHVSDLHLKFALWPHHVEVW